MNITTAVIPLAGFGTRFLPATRTVPKGLLPVWDRPAIHYCVEEAVLAGIQRIVFVVSPGQEALMDYFRGIPDLERHLARKGDQELLELMEQIPNLASFSHVYQEQQLGLGHAISVAKEQVGGEPFAVMLPDDLMWADVPAIKGVVDAFHRFHGSVVTVKQVPKAEVSRSGIVAVEAMTGGVSRVTRLVEKPLPSEAPSDLAVIGRYALTPEIFDALEQVQPGAGGEIQITDAISLLLASQEVYAYRFSGLHIDVGVPEGLLRASLHVAMQEPDRATRVKRWLAGY